MSAAVIVPAGAVLLAPPRSLSEAVTYLERFVSEFMPEVRLTTVTHPKSSEYWLEMGSVTFSNTLLWTRIWAPSRESIAVFMLLMSAISCPVANFSWIILFIIVVIDMSGTEPQRRPTRTEIQPIIVGIGDAEVASVFGPVTVTVTDQTGLPVIVEVCTARASSASSDRPVCNGRHIVLTKRL